jgi:hypothetical protein
MWVEVEVLMKVWRESYGVTPDDAINLLNELQQGTQ